MHSARLDNWREIAGLAEKWQAGAAQRADLDAAVAAVEAVEAYHAYPGGAVRDAARADRSERAGSAARLARRISNGLVTAPIGIGPGNGISTTRWVSARWPTSCRPAGEVGTAPSLLRGPLRFSPAGRALAGPRRRSAPTAPSRGQFVYEPVFVGSFEDAVCAATVNPSLTSVVVAEGFPYRSRFDAPVLRAVLDPLGERGYDASALRLAGSNKEVERDDDLKRSHRALGE